MKEANDASVLVSRFVTASQQHLRMKKKRRNENYYLYYYKHVSVFISNFCVLFHVCRLFFFLLLLLRVCGQQPLMYTLVSIARHDTLHKAPFSAAVSACFHFVGRKDKNKEPSGQWPWDAKGYSSFSVRAVCYFVTATNATRRLEYLSHRNSLFTPFVRPSLAVAMVDSRHFKSCVLSSQNVVAVSFVRLWLSSFTVESSDGIAVARSSARPSQMRKIATEHRINFLLSHFLRSQCVCTLVRRVWLRATFRIARPVNRLRLHSCGCLCVHVANLMRRVKKRPQKSGTRKPRLNCFHSDALFRRDSFPLFAQFSLRTLSTGKKFGKSHRRSHHWLTAVLLIVVGFRVRFFSISSRSICFSI